MTIQLLADKALLSDQRAKLNANFQELDARAVPHQSQVPLAATATADQVEVAVETLLPEQETASPAGMGREVRLPSGQLLVRPMSLSTMQSVSGPAVAASILLMDHTALTAGQETAVYTVPADSRSKRGNRGQGSLTTFTMDGARQAIEAAFGVLPSTPAAAYPIVHGYRAVDDVKRAHRMADVNVSNTTGHGIWLGLGADQARGTARAEGCRGTALRIQSASDVKMYGLGMQGEGLLAPDDPTSLLIENAAPELTGGGDFWPVDTAPLGKYVAAIRTSNGAFLQGLTIAGPMLVKGRNAQGISVRYGNTYHQLHGCTFKHKVRAGAGNSAFTASISGTTLTVTGITAGYLMAGVAISGAGVTPGTTILAAVSGLGGVGTYTVSASQTVASTAMVGVEVAPKHYLRVEDADQLQLVAPIFEFDNTLPAGSLPDYLISIGTEAGNQDRSGSVSIVGAAHMMESGRPGATGGAMLPRIGAKKGVCDRPKALLINGMPVGTPVLVPAWSVDAPDLALRSHVALDGQTLNTADYPLLWWSLNAIAGGTLDAAPATFVMPSLTHPSAAWKYALPARF